MDTSVYRFNNSYRLNGGKVQYRLSGYYPEAEQVLLKFGELPMKIPARDLQGIPLEKYVLVQFGFKQDGFHSKFWQKGDFILYLAGKGQYRLAYKHQVLNKVFRYLHQLQNIYYDYTGVELG